MEIKGNVIAICDIQTGTTAKGDWKSQYFIIETDEQYKKKIAINLYGDKVDQLPKIGDSVSCEVNIESREYNGKWYTKVSLWKFNGNTQTAKQPLPEMQDTPDNTTAPEINEMPF